MKLLYIASSVIPSQSANSIHVMKMAAALSHHFHSVHLAVPKWTDHRAIAANDIFDFYGVPSSFLLHRFEISGLGGYSLRYPLAIAKWLRNEKMDLVYGRSILGIVGAVRQHVPTFLEVHAPLSTYPIIERAAFQWIAKQKNFAGLVVISEELKKICRQEPLTRQQRIWVLHDGADLPKSYEKESLPGNFAINVGYFGHLQKHRGIENIIELCKMFPDIGFQIVGGRERDVMEWSNTVSSPNLFFHGFVEPSRVPRLQQSCDILLAPYQSQGRTASYMSPLKIFESMASGRPLICSDLPVIREVLNTSNAVLVSPNDISAWRNGLERLRDPLLRRQLGERAQSDLARHYTWERRAAAIKELASAGH